jgi:multisubunit Na+/H+ antiporter MnhC subunit
MTHLTYITTVFLMVAGLYIVIARGNLIKKSSRFRARRKAFVITKA